MAAALKIPEPSKPTILQPGEEEKNLVQGYTQESQSVQQRVAPIRSEMQQVGQEISGIQNPTPPKLQPVPEFQARQTDGGDMLAFAGIATALATLATKSVRGDITLALNTAGNAMKGFQEGNVQQAKLDIENFNTKMKSIVENNNQMLREYDAVVKDRKLTLAQKQAKLAVLGSQYQDELAMSALRKGDMRFMLERLDKIREANNKAEVNAAKMQTQWALQMGRLEAMMDMQERRISSMNPNAGHTQYSPEAIDMLARASLKDKSSLANIGRGIQGARDLAAINNRAAEILAKEGGGDVAANRAEFRANSNSLNKMVMQYDAISSFEKNALANGKVLVDLAEKVDATGIPVIERWIRAGRKAVEGDPDVSAFHTQLLTFRAETAKILTNPNLTGSLTVHAQQEAESLVGGNDSAEQISRVVGLLEQDFGRRERFLIEQMNAARDRMTGVGKAAGAPASTAPQHKEGDKSKSKTGRDMTFKNGRWEYD